MEFIPRGVVNLLEKIKKGLVVSCQALSHEPLHSSYIMGRMAYAVTEGGACGIRANGEDDIEEIKKQTSLPIIGIVKRDYPDSSVYITATMREIEELAKTNCEMIAMDATDSKRADKETIEDFIKKVKQRVPDTLLMADISTIEEAIRAERIGFDCVATTLIGYTEKTKGLNIADNDFAILKKIVHRLNIPVIAEGSINTPKKAKRCLKIGAHAVVVGSAITRPKWITENFVKEIKNP